MVMKKLALEFETISNELKHENAQLLLVTITNNLYQDVHVSEMVKKASKRLGFLGAIKASLCQEGRFAQVLHQLHIRSVCNYAIPVFHARLPQYLIDDLERVQKRALSIICPTLKFSGKLYSSCPRMSEQIQFLQRRLDCRQKSNRFLIRLAKQ